MTIRYFSDFIFKQKCLPYFLVKKWRVLVNFVRELRFIQIIDLDKTYVNYVDGGYNLENIFELKESQLKSYLFKNSIYVNFLEQFKDKSNVIDNEIKKSEYYQSSFLTMQTHGICRQNTNEIELLAQCQYFLNLYRAIKYGTYFQDYKKFIVCETHSSYLYPLVFKIKKSNYYMIQDGHHRLACLYVLGNRFVKAKIAGAIKGAF